MTTNRSFWEIPFEIFNMWLFPNPYKIATKNFLIKSPYMILLFNHA